jgi:hypothetical protein
MAQQRRSNNTRRTNSNQRSRAKSSNGSRRNTSGRNSGRRPQSKQTEAVTFADYWHAFSRTRAFFPVMTILVIVLVVLIDLLVSWNSFDRFFLILGIELVVLAAAWIIGLVMSIGNEAQPAEFESDDE